MKVTVTQDHIDRGTRNNAATCPIALAMTEACGQPIQVGSEWYGPGFADRTHELPIAAKDFIREFDGERPVAPFEMEVECPAP